MSYIRFKHAMTAALGMRRDTPDAALLAILATATAEQRLTVYATIESLLAQPEPSEPEPSEAA